MGDTLQLDIGEKDGKVVMRFGKQVSEVAIDPETARALGEKLARSAYSIKYGTQFSGASIISEQTRNKLVNRIVHIIRSEQEKNKKPLYVATQVVDTVLSEVS